MNVESQTSRRFQLFRSDYLRLEGYAGALDTYYCGKGEKISIKLHKNSALKMTFKGQDRGSQYKNENDKRILELLEGFNCEVQCKEANTQPMNSTNIISTASTSVPKPTTQPSITNAQSNQISSLPSG